MFRDQRKLRGMWLADDENGVTAVIGEQGPDALGLPGRRLEERLAGRRGALKSVLMDQRVVAGLGNMLSDEVLWRARIHPSRRFGDLQPHERAGARSWRCSESFGPRCRSERSRGRADVAQLATLPPRPALPTLPGASGNKPCRRAHLVLVPGLPAGPCLKPRLGGGWRRLWNPRADCPGRGQSDTCPPVPDLRPRLSPGRSRFATGTVPFIGCGDAAAVDVARSAYRLCDGFTVSLSEWVGGLVLVGPVLEIATLGALDHWSLRFEESRRGGSRRQSGGRASGRLGLRNPESSLLK